METNKNYWLVNLTYEEIAILSHVVATSNYNYRKQGSFSYFDGLHFRLSLCLDGLKANSLLLSYDELEKLVNLLALADAPTSKFRWVNEIDAGKTLYAKLLTARNNIFITISLGKTIRYNCAPSYGYVVRYDIISSDCSLDDALVVEFSDGTRAIAPYLSLSFFK